ncbi:MAG: desulfoferrodoxin [Lentisphaeria bacterium]|nr:desulfoferrodoxin [Lentisphaeria bacterium]
MANTISSVYHCPHCGLTVEVTSPGADPVCCGEKMILCRENTVDASREKHVPVPEALAQGTRVRVGSAEHPMTPEHYIQWIEVINGPYVNRRYLKPGEAPVAEFYVPFSDKLEIRAYCNLHGLWKK